MLNENNKVKPRKSIPGIIFKAALVLAALLIFYVIFTFSLFYYFKDDIRNAVLHRFNEKINGNISFTDISFTPLKYFPDISLNFTDLTLTEPDTINTAADTIFSFRNVYISVDVMDLLSSRINVPKAAVEEGYLIIIMRQDSSLNIAHALRKKTAAPVIKKDKSQDPQQEKDESQKSKQEKAGSYEINLNIEQLTFSDVKINAENYLTENKFGINIRNYDSRINYSAKRIFSNFILDLSIDSLIIKDKLILSDKNLSLDSRIHIDTEAEYVKIDSSRLTFNEARFNFSGSYDLKNEGYVDLAVTGKDITSSLLSLFLKERGKKSLQKGTAEFTAVLKGKTYTQMPLIDMKFSLNDVALVNPVTNRLIRNLNLKASFISGSKNDLSESVLIVDTMHADFPDGLVKLSGKVKNFDSPELDINLFLDADVTGLEDIFKLDAVDDVRGRIKISERYKGIYFRSSKKLITALNNLDINFKDFGISIPGAIKLDKVNGAITRRNDDYVFNELRIIYKDTDLLINGELSNLHYLFFGVEKDITADLKIKGPVFNLPDFLFFDPSIKRDFPHRITGLDISVIAKTSTTKCLNFNSFPEIDFEIKMLDATVEDFLPRLNIKSGRLLISENILGFNLKFDRFKTEFLDGKFNFTGEYNNSSYEKFYVKLKADFTNIHPSILFNSESDTAAGLLSGKLSGSFFTDFQFPVDTLELKFINLRDGNLTYVLPDDTLITKNLSFSFSNIYFNENADPNPFATLSTSGNFKADLIKSNKFRFSDFVLDIKASGGTYEVKSNETRFFGEDSRGNSYWNLKPFADVPSFSLKWNITRFYAEKMLAAYMEEETISGPLSLSININSHGKDWNKIVEGLEGEIKLNGQDLTLYGLDADKVIDNFQRSQSFNLVDLGGVLLAGPVGLVLTKGTDYARLLVLNPGESSKITNLVSNWKIKKGTFHIEDAAFTTAKNRIALKGSISIARDSLNLVVALLDEYGSSVFLQEVYGKLGAPVMGKVKVIGTLAAPVTNLYNDVFQVNRDIFYNGSLKHPEK